MKRGFSLLELLLCLALLSLTLLLSFGSLRQGSTSEQTRSLALVLAERLRAARETAWSSGIPTGLVFPAGSPLCQSLAGVQGEARGRGQVSYRWANEFPQAAVFLGHWDTGSSWTPPPASSRLDLSSWLPQPGPAFVFLPGGQLLTNQPGPGNKAVLLVVGGARHSGDVLQAAYRPWSVEVGPEGNIEVVRGVSGRDNFPETAAGLALGSGLGPNRAAANTAPVLERVEPCPPPYPGSLPPGIDASVSPGGYLTFAAYAHDAEGDRLRCQWTADAGGLSSSEECEMHWDAGSGRWIGHWTFTPPPTAAIHDVFTLSCRVRDAHGGEDSGTFGLGGRILVTRRSKLAYLSDVLTGDRMRLHVFACNTEGTERKQITTQPAHLLAPRWSPDGSQILYLSGPVEASPHSLRVVNADGSNDSLVLDPGGQWSRGVYCATFSFDGNRIYALASHEGEFDLVSLRVDGSERQIINPGGTRFSGRPSFTGLALHPGSGNLLVENHLGQMWFVDPDRAVALPLVQSEAREQTELCFAGDGNTLYLSPDNTGLYRASFSFDGTTARVGAFELIASGEIESPSIGLDPDMLFFQRKNSEEVRHLVRYSLSQRQETNLSTGNLYEDDCWITTYPENEL